MINPKVKAGCGVVTVFALGFGLGVITLLIVLVKVIPLSEGWKSEASKDFVAGQISRQLQLTEEQKVEFRPLVDAALEKRWALRREYLLEDRRLMEEEFFPRIAQLLTDEQKKKGQKLLERWRRDQRFKLESEEAAAKQEQQGAASSADPAEEPSQSAD